MDRLWAQGSPQTVREVHSALSQQRELAYTTVMTVLQRLTKKGLVTRLTGDRAHRYTAARTRDEFVAELMVDALATGTERDGRAGALTRFVQHVTPAEAHALRAALDALDAGTATPRG